MRPGGGRLSFRRPTIAYDPVSDRARRRHPCRGAGHSHALRGAEAAAPAVRTADHRLAGRGRAGGRRRQGRRRRFARAQARGRSRPSSTATSRWRSKSARSGPPMPSRRRRRRSAPTDTVVVINGDVPLITAATIRALVDDHEHTGAAGTIATMVLDDPAGYGRVVRAPDGTVEKVVETKAPGDATELELHIREVNTGVFAFDGGALTAALGEVRANNSQGELYLPDVLPILREHERTVMAHELDRSDRAAADQRPPPARRGHRGRPAPDPGAPHARRGDDRQPGRDRDRRRGRDRPGHGDRALHKPARHDRRSAADRRSGRARP